VTSKISLKSNKKYFDVFLMRAEKQWTTIEGVVEGVGIRRVVEDKAFQSELRPFVEGIFEVE
jgi:hypothetical protein